MEQENPTKACQSLCNSCQIDDPPQSLSPLHTIKAPPKDQCGYDCEFLNPAPTLIQTECSICLQILRDPHLIGCCGHNYCKTCIQQISKNNRPCPLCGEEEYGVLSNKGLMRSLRDLEVVCSKKSLGCPWSGKLGQFDAHLNEDYTSESQLQGCEYVEVECVHGCGSHFLRALITKHQTERCPQRPYCCDYCRDYTSIHADVVYRHWPVCKAYPLSCPNQCTVYAIERQDLEKHLDSECPLKIVDCDFQHAGCEVRLPRQELPSHLADCYIQHMTMLGSLNQRLIEELADKDEEITKLSNEFTSKLSDNKREMDQLRGENSILKFSLSQLQSEMASMFDTLKQTMADIQAQHKAQESKLKYISEQSQSKVTELDSKIDCVHYSLSTQCYSIQAHLGQFPISFKMTEYEKHRLKSTEWISPPFRSDLKGYKFCLVVDADGNGLAKGDYVSVFACLMQGESDENLTWPFCGEITVQLLNQLGDRNHATGTIRFTTFTPSTFSSRVYGDGHGPKGWGQQKFIGHKELAYNEVKKRQYLKDDSLCFRVTRVELST